MKSLSKEHEATKSDLAERLKSEADGVVGAYNKVTEAIDALNEVIAKYNDIVAELEEFKGEVVGDMEEYYDERSEKWQEGDAGTSFYAWKSDWEGLDTDPVDTVENPGELTLSHADSLDGLNEEVGE